VPGKVFWLIIMGEARFLKSIYLIKELIERIENNVRKKLKEKW